MDNVATGKRVQRTAAQWRSIMARQEASGLTCEAFCAAEGIGRSAFWRWRRRLADEEAASAGNGGPMFVELPGAGAASWDAELELGGGVVLRVRRPRC
ncbi:MAG: IS66 family insertion sequence element accessory protein TnpB [Gammaproteobacteria bacterium]|nr:IS66 family insertion sequence element accessory protein TnpB [Gammaproteobacteria bacterium]